jgi:hypothetical protein
MNQGNPNGWPQQPQQHGWQQQAPIAAQPVGPAGMPQRPMVPVAPGAMTPAAVTPAAMAPQSATVHGVALQPGERVVYYSAPNYSTSKTIYLVLGIMFALILVGLIFFWIRSRIEKKNPRAIIVTTLRVIVIEGSGLETVHWLQNVADIEPLRQNHHHGGGGLVGALVGAAVSAVANSMADKKGKVDPKYWARAYGIKFKDHSGNEQDTTCQETPKEMVNLGVFVARGMVEGGYQQMASVQHPA